jgi:hypothetical protein
MGLNFSLGLRLGVVMESERDGKSLSLGEKFEERE